MNFGWTDELSPHLSSFWRQYESDPDWLIVKLMTRNLLIIWSNLHPDRWSRTGPLNKMFISHAVFSKVTNSLAKCVCDWGWVCWVVVCNVVSCCVFVSYFCITYFDYIIMLWQLDHLGKVSLRLWFLFVYFDKFNRKILNICPKNKHPTPNPLTCKQCHM